MRLFGARRLDSFSSTAHSNRLVRAELEVALGQLTEHDFLEIDQYGASAKILSGLSEYHLVKNLESHGYTVMRMPEDMARHLGHYANFDFLVEKNGVSKKVEAKFLWGTDTRFARLIHSTTTAPAGPEENWTPEQRANYYPTSSCKFATHAVGLFLRTGNIADFAFARSIPRDVHPHGLPRTANYPEHVNQNPLCTELATGVGSQVSMRYGISLSRRLFSTNFDS